MGFLCRLATWQSPAQDVSKPRPPEEPETGSPPHIELEALDFPASVRWGLPQFMLEFQLCRVSLGV